MIHLESISNNRLVMPNHVTHLQCVSCDERFKESQADYTCPKCGPLLGTLDVVYDYERIAQSLSRESLAQNQVHSQWRYKPLLPVEPAAVVPELRSGWTPLYPSKSLAAELGLSKLHFKDDSRNPTASFKDRASAVGIVRATSAGATTVTAASTGNAASSWSAFAALARIPAIIFVPHSAPRAKIAQLLLYGATVLKVDGTYDDAFELCCQAAENWGWYNRSTAINPYLGEGKKTAAMELCEQLNWELPDYVFISVGDGCIYQSFHKGFLDLKRIGLIDTIPKLVGVQAAGSAPLVMAWNNGADSCVPQEVATIADSISVGVPRDQVKALRAARKTQGAFIAVEDGEILAAMRELAQRSGIFAEPAGAAAFAGLRKMAADGKFAVNSTAVVLVSGHGLKDIDGVFKATNNTAAEIDNTLDAVEQTVFGNA